MIAERPVPGRPPSRRLGLGGLAVVAGLAAFQAPLPAQDSTKVQLQVTLSADSTAAGVRAPLLRALNLLNDPRWLAMLRSGFPVRLHYRAELWRSRGAWFDAYGKDVEWDIAVRHEPLLDQYTVITVFGRSRRENQYATLEALSSALSVRYRVALTPTEEGEYYYVGSLQITTLSDSDLDELERFFEGDVAPAAEGKEDFGSMVGRGAKRLVLKLAGLPSLRLEERSPRFQVRPGG